MNHIIFCSQYFDISIREESLYSFFDKKICYSYHMSSFFYCQLRIFAKEKGWRRFSNLFQLKRINIGLLNKLEIN